MSSWKNLLHKLALKTESNFDGLKLRLYKRLGADLEIIVIPYNSFATKSSLLVKGRVLRNKRIDVKNDDFTLGRFAYKASHACKVQVVGSVLAGILPQDLQGYAGRILFG